MFEEAQNAIKTRNGKGRLMRLTQGTEDSAKFIGAMAKLTQVVSIMQVSILRVFGDETPKLIDMLH